MSAAGDPDVVAAKLLSALDLLARGQRSHRQRAATSHRLSPLQAELLLTLHGGVPPVPLVGQLAREMAVSQPTATDSIRSLERKGLLERRPDPVDGRRSLVELTAAGAALADQLAASERDLSAATAGLGTDRREQLLEGLLELVAAFVDDGVVDVARTCTTCRHQVLRAGKVRHCSLLQVDLPPAELRVNCPEHLSAMSSPPD